MDKESGTERVRFKWVLTNTDTCESTSVFNVDTRDEALRIFFPTWHPNPETLYAAPLYAAELRITEGSRTGIWYITLVNTDTDFKLHWERA